MDLLSIIVEKTCPDTFKVAIGKNPQGVIYKSSQNSTTCFADCFYINRSVRKPFPTGTPT